MAPVQIRPADPDRDAAGCADIYAPFVTGSSVSFEEVAPDAGTIAGRMARLAASHAYLVADDALGVAGFAYGGPHRERPGYRWSTEVSVYVHERCRGQGIGRELYSELLPRLARRGLWVALAGITLPNPASVALHERCGFEPVGVYRRIGWKAGAWRDVGWWQYRLRGGDGGAPANPT
jgi:phosphinothricin acetyltransferase